MDRNFHINGIMAIAVGSLTLIAVYWVTVGPAFSAAVIPHQAFYEMQLGKTDRNSNVQAVTGRSAFTLGRDCSGWQSNEDYLIYDSDCKTIDKYIKSNKIKSRLLPFSTKKKVKQGAYFFNNEINIITGKKEKPASKIRTAHKVLSPCIFSKILFIIIF